MTMIASVISASAFSVASLGNQLADFVFGKELGHVSFITYAPR